MSDQYLAALVIGITTGSVYAIAALGLVLTYKTSGVFNFAHGAVAAAGAYVFYELRDLHGLSWPVAALIAIFVFGPLAGLLMERLAAGLEGASTAYKIGATLGLILIVQGIAFLRYGPAAKTLRPFLSTRIHVIGGVNVGNDKIIIVVLALLAAIGIYAFFRVSRLGTAMRAVVDDAPLLDMTGTNPVRVRRAAWFIGCAFASLSGILLAPLAQLDVFLLILLVVQAFGAAAIGAFRSLPLTYLGGLFIGIATAVSKVAVADHHVLANVPGAMPFLVLFVVLLVVPRSRLVEAGSTARARLTQLRPLPPNAVAAVTAVGLLFLIVVPSIVGTNLPLWSSGIAQASLFLSLSLLLRTSGQVSLCQIGFAAVGAAMFSHLAHGAGLPWLLAVIGAGLITVPFGLVIAIPAIRLSGLFLALATFGFGILLSYVYTANWMFGESNGIVAPRPAGFGSDKKYYYLLLAVLVACAALVALVERSRLGRLLRAMADSPIALSTHGTNVNVTRVLVFGLSAFLAGVAGAVTAPLDGVVSQDSFFYFNSLVLLTVLVVVGWTGTVRSAVLGALLLSVLPGYISNEDFSNYLNIMFGLSAVGTALVMSRGGAGTFVVRSIASSTDRVRGPAGARQPLRKQPARQTTPA